MEKGVTIEIGGYAVRRESSAEVTRVIMTCKSRESGSPHLHFEEARAAAEFRLWEAESPDNWREAEALLSVVSPPYVSTDRFLAPVPNMAFLTWSWDATRRDVPARLLP